MKIFSHCIDGCFVLLKYLSLLCIRNIGVAFSNCKGKLVVTKQHTAGVLLEVRQGIVLKMGYFFPHLHVMFIWYPNELNVKWKQNEQLLEEKTLYIWRKNRMTTNNGIWTIFILMLFSPDLPCKVTFNHFCYVRVSHLALLGF